jgi:hypothetical protein
VRHPLEDLALSERLFYFLNIDDPEVPTQPIEERIGWVVC